MPQKQGTLNQKLKKKKEKEKYKRKLCNTCYVWSNCTVTLNA